MKKQCEFCHKEYTKPIKVDLKAWSIRKYCSRKCYNLASKGRLVTWGDKISKSRLGHGWPEGYKNRQSIAQKERFKTQNAWNKGLAYGKSREYWQNENWYSALHKWVRRHKGTPLKCEHCGSEDKKRYYWANKSHTYQRDLEDWLRLCGSCHMKYDKVYE